MSALYNRPALHDCMHLTLTCISECMKYWCVFAECDLESKTPVTVHYVLLKVGMSPSLIYFFTFSFLLGIMIINTIKMCLPAISVLIYLISMTQPVCTHVVQTPLRLFLQCINQQGWSRISLSSSEEKKQSLLKLIIITLTHTHTHKGSKPSSHPKLRDNFASLGCFLELISKRVPSGSPAPQSFIIQHTSSLPGLILQLDESSLLQNNILQTTVRLALRKQQKAAEAHCQPTHFFLT